jgi:Tfp pilus assembly protein PilO
MNTIDQATKVNLGILGTLLVSVIGATVYLSTLQVNVAHISSTLSEVKSAIDRTNLQMSLEGKSLAVLQALVQSIERRVELLEKDRPR